VVSTLACGARNLGSIPSGRKRLVLEEAHTTYEIVLESRICEDRCLDGVQSIRLYSCRQVTDVDSSIEARVAIFLHGL
jgi:hypothetical protein